MSFQVGLFEGGGTDFWIGVFLLAGVLALFGVGVELASAVAGSGPNPVLLGIMVFGAVASIVQLVTYARESTI